jgi:two-component system OmpR family sensor kinase
MRWGRHRHWQRRGDRQHYACGHRRGRLRAPRRVFWRVYLFGLLLLFAVTVSLAVSGSLLYDEPPWTAQLSRYINSELSPLIEQPEALARKLDSVHQAFEVDLAIYHRDGSRLASAGQPPAAEDEMPTKRSMRRRGRAHVWVVPLRSGDAYVVGRAAFRYPGGSRWMLMLGVVLVVLALVSLPLAHSFVRPIEKVTRAARAVGEGDLSARTGLHRHDELGDLARAFDQMAERLERMVSTEKELLANVSHELRTPLARIRVALELAEDDAGGDSAAQLQHLRGIGDDLRELEQLINDVLMTARLDLAGGNESRLAPDRKPASMETLCREALERFATRHPEHDAVLDADDELPEVMVDSKMIRRVLDNLLDNAAKYSEPDTPITVAIAWEGDDAPLLVSVRDAGIGVDEADLPLLFEPFFRSERVRERGSAGVGLGLALCRRIVEAHRGHIEAKALETGGLEVSFSVPLSLG